jgi:hypothetical protein
MAPHQTTCHAQSRIETHACVSVIVCPFICPSAVHSFSKTLLLSAKPYFFQQYFFKKIRTSLSKTTLSKTVLLSAKPYFLQQHGFSKTI